ncbi:unnamed protein product [Closterium sp. Naga37s-1]|nr:unnamed protein product [Closterium sp. Naga37s-1]
MHPFPVGLYAPFPGRGAAMPLLDVALPLLDVALPLLVKRSRVQPPAPAAAGTSARAGGGEASLRVLSPIDYVPAACASWRLSLLNDQSGLSDAVLRSIRTPTLLVASSKDRVLPAVAETGRLLNLLPHSKRVILPTRCPFLASSFSAPSASPPAAIASCASARLPGHTVLLEADVDIAAILATHGFAPTNHTPPRKHGKRSVVADEGSEATMKGEAGEAVIGREGEEAATRGPYEAESPRALRGGGRAEAPLGEQGGLQPVGEGDGGGDGRERGEGDGGGERGRGETRRRRRRRKSGRQLKGRELERLYEEVGRSMDTWRVGGWEGGMERGRCGGG